jgi:hypothetical protein
MVKGKQGLKPPWQPGQSGNPKGRQKGSRNRLCEQFLQDFYETWQAHGAVGGRAEEHGDA